MPNIITLKSQVEIILKNSPESRNSDITLMIELWKRFYPKCMIEDEYMKTSIYLNDLYNLPREDGISRIRRHFQNDRLLYLPTKLEVVVQRKINQEVWRKTMTAMEGIYPGKILRQ